MPRIDAPTVAEHRAARERALLDAARSLVTADPDTLPTLAEVGRLAGLSRSSVYQYYASREDLLAAVVRDSFPRWQERIERATTAATTPRERLLAFLRVNLELVADGEHALARTLQVVLPSEDLARHAQDFHDRLLDPVVAALTDLGAPDVDLTTELVNAVVHAASRRVETGGPVDDAYRVAATLLDPYLRELEAPGTAG